MTAIAVTAANVSANDRERGAIIKWYQAGATITLGQAVYTDSNFLVYPAKADSASHATALGVAALSDNFYGETTVPTGGQVGVVIYGPVWGFASMIGEENGWVSGATAGGLDDTAPTGGAWQFQVGHAVDDQTFFVDPNPQSAASHA